LAALPGAHDPNAIDALRFGSRVAFQWAAVSKTRRRRSPALSAGRC
jgi:hypothetical protein